MSGICAVWHKSDPSRIPEALHLVTAGLRLNPSEQARTAIDEPVGIAVSSRFESQQCFEDPQVLVACDVDCYNLPELLGLIGRSEGEPLSTAAAIARLYKQLGRHFVDRLRGQFSIVVWDRLQKTLFAAVDGCGIASLVYYEDEKVLLVGSRIDALLNSGNIPADINPRSVANYLNYTVALAPETFIRNVKRLLPGTCLVASNGQTSTRSYWDARYEPTSDRAENDLAGELESLVEKSVKHHCGGKFSNLGAFLSGGTDSSTVVGMMARLKRGPVKAFSIGFDEERFNELTYARISARKFQAEHLEYLVNATDCMKVIPDMVRYFDQPFGNSSAIPTYFCAKLAAENNSSVLLAGDGGDELFGGNERYVTDNVFHIYQHVPAFLRSFLVEPALNIVPRRAGLLRSMQSYVRRSNLPNPERYFSYNLLLANSLGSIFERDFVQQLNGYSVLDRPSAYYRDGPARDRLNRLLYLDLKVTLADNDLPKVTRMAELAGTQARFPLLDRSLVEFAGHIPVGLKVRGFKKRYLFKRAFRDLLPQDVLRKKKHGFGIPVSMWMKSDPRMRALTHDILLSRRMYERGIVRRSFVEDLLSKHEFDSTAFYGDTLWTFLTLELWFRQFVDRSRSLAA